MTTPEDTDVQKMIERIDSLDVKMPKQQRLFDTDQEIATVESDLVSLRRMLKQHHNAKAVVSTQQGGQFMLGPTVQAKIAQLKRLREYRTELEALPEDEDAPPRSDEG